MEVTDQELGIRFFPPNGWELKQTLISKRAVSGNGTGKEGMNFSYNPIYVFF